MSSSAILESNCESNAFSEDEMRRHRSSQGDIKAMAFLGGGLFKISAKMGVFARCDCPFGSGLEQIGIGNIAHRIQTPLALFTPPDALN